VCHAAGEGRFAQFGEQRGREAQPGIGQQQHRRHHQHSNICRFGATCTHGGEGFMAWRINKN
jgi:hypothetical protein